jgi:hypothetical protein
MMSLRTVSIVICVGILAALPLAAKEKDADPAAPKIFRDVVDCRKIAADTERLACYDQHVASLETAQQKKELYVADKEEVETSRRKLFGLTLPRIRIFGGDNEADSEIDEIETTITTARSGSQGHTFILEDGAVWVQADSQYIGVNPKAGNKIKIKKAALGSYMAKVENGRSFRIKRINN